MGAHREKTALHTPREGLAHAALAGNQPHPTLTLGGQAAERINVCCFSIRLWRFGDRRSRRKHGARPAPGAGIGLGYHGSRRPAALQQGGVGCKEKRPGLDP